MKFRIPAMALSLVMVSAGTAFAQEQGWYVSGGLGPIGLRDSIVTPPPSSGGTPAASYKVGHKIDAQMQVSLGYQWNQLRIEDEISYANVQGDSYSPSGHTTIGSDMFNLIYELPIYDRWSFDIGAGAGAARVEQSYAGILSGDRIRFAWQGIAGVSYVMAPGADFFMDYHHREFMGGNYNSPNPALNPSTVSDVVTDGAVMGVRWYMMP